MFPERGSTLGGPVPQHEGGQSHWPAPRTPLGGQIHGAYWMLPVHATSHSAARGSAEPLWDWIA